MSGKPFSTRRLVECMDAGAERFGWDKRAAPGTRREGEWLIGMGMAAAVRINLLMTSEARVRLTGDGRVAVETDMTDIGTGTYTILAQIAARGAGRAGRLRRRGAGRHRSADRRGIGRIVRRGERGFVGSAGVRGYRGASWRGGWAANADDMTLKDGHAIAGNRRVPLGELAGADADRRQRARSCRARTPRSISQAAHGAQFAEVAVNAITGEMRVRRMTGVFEAGRILNAKTARSQAIGGMIWGIGYALMEGAELDLRNGQFVNQDLGEYLIPAHADVPPLDVEFLEFPDHHANPIGVKGLGELAISGAAAAVANAVYNACGVRVRSFRSRCDKLLGGTARPLMAENDSVLAAARAWKGEPLALATVVSTWGSAPRPRGSHMLVHADGRFEGSVSGGCVESDILATAAEVIAGAPFVVKRYGVADAAAWEVGLPCGGEIAVLVQPVSAAGFDPELFDRIAEARDDGAALTVAHRPRRPGTATCARSRPARRSSTATIRRAGC